MLYKITTFGNFSHLWIENGECFVKHISFNANIIAVLFCKYIYKTSSIDLIVISQRIPPSDFTKNLSKLVA
jgi:hypothetical protein